MQRLSKDQNLAIWIAQSRKKGICLMLYEDSCRGEQKKLNVPPQAYQRVLILCICEVCLPYSTGLLGSYAFTKLKEICTLFMKGATKKYYCDVLWCMWSVSEVLLVGFFICYAYKLQVPEVYNIKGLRLSFNKKKKKVEKHLDPTLVIGTMCLRWQLL